MNRSLAAGCILLIMLIITAIAAPYLPFVDTSLKEHVMMKQEDGSFSLPPYEPSKQFPIGSDQKGVDLLSRLLLGTKETLLTVLGIAIMRYILAIPLGVGSFYFKPARYLLNIWNRLFSYMPPIFFLALLLGIPFIVFSEDRTLWFMIVIALVDVGRVADIFYKTLVGISKKPYVESGVVSGCSNWKMLRTYYWPPLQPHVLIQFFSDIGRILFLIAQLGVVRIYISLKFVSQLGGGYDAVNTSNAWPTFFINILEHIWSHAWIPFTGVIAIAVTIFTFSLISSGLQQFFDRKFKRYQGMDL
ncbi:ABC transporter permease subunit [Falsibacillus pallidus]|uniref:Peptide/nickel transport system permease protein n=1 Tax=Falsibacillus pallidus TaxID=493781 RepID=A0A370G9K5_9BACI|nr:ABC transporter permease subunit [Falsibacillus pallidus]RDI39890.1 peptide/nickel transport system permease protein [Falsibacillus pallidus]